MLCGCLNLLSSSYVFFSLSLLSTVGLFFSIFGLSYKTEKKYNRYGHREKSLSAFSVLVIHRAEKIIISVKLPCVCAQCLCRRAVSLEVSAGCSMVHAGMPIGQSDCDRAAVFAWVNGQHQRWWQHFVFYPVFCLLVCVGLSWPLVTDKQPSFSAPHKERKSFYSHKT